MEEQMTRHRPKSYIEAGNVRIGSVKVPKLDDRRIQRTRIALRDALIGLMLEKDYEEITVGDIIERANIGRSTFYVYFTDKPDLLRSNLQYLRGILEPPRDGPETSRRPIFSFTTELFAHCHSHRAIYAGRRSATLLLRLFAEIVADLVRADLVGARPRRELRIPLEAVVQFVSGACISVLTWSIDQPASTRETMETMFRELVLPGVLATLTLPPKRLNRSTLGDAAGEVP
jgi:AcrR family transcriptional regulator